MAIIIIGANALCWFNLSHTLYITMDREGIGILNCMATLLPKFFKNLMLAQLISKAVCELAHSFNVKGCKRKYNSNFHCRKNRES